MIFAKMPRESYVLTSQEARDIDSSYDLALSGFHYPNITVNLINPKSSCHLSLLESPPDRGTKYSTAVISRGYRYFIEVPTAWSPFPNVSNLIYPNNLNGQRNIFILCLTIINRTKWAQSHLSRLQHSTRIKRKDEWRTLLVYKGNSDEDTHVE